MDILHFVALKSGTRQTPLAWPGDRPLQSYGAWRAGTCSPFVRPRQALLADLLACGQPFLCITLRQAESWQLTAGAGGRLLTDFRHVFRAPADPPDPDLAGILAGLGLPAETTALPDFLTAVPAADPVWPAGDLPRFLALLGFSGIFPAAGEDPAERESRQLRSRIASSGCGDLVTAKLCDRAPTALAAPVRLAWGDLRQLFRLAWFADDNASPVLGLRGPGTEKLNWPAGGTSHLARDGEGVRIGFDFYGSPFQIFGWLDDALAFLHPLLQPGWEAELMTAPVSAREAGYSDEPGPENLGGYHWYRGRLDQQGGFEIRETWPAMEPSTLAAALQLSAWVDRGGPLPLPDEQAAIAFAEQLKASFDVDAKQVRRSGASLVIADAYERAFAARCRFVWHSHGPWDLTRARALQSEVDEAGDELQAAAQQLIKAIQKPHTGEVVYQGASGQFLAGDAGGLAPAAAQALPTLTEEMEDTGFFALGDIVWEPGGDVFIRLFGHAGGAAYGVVMVSFGGIVTELQTTFSDQGGVLTSTLAELSHDAHNKVLKFSYPGLSVPRLWEKHRAHVMNYQQENQAEPQTAVADFQAFLRHLDAQLARQLGTA